MSDRGRHALDEGTDARSDNANWDADNFELCTGGKGIAFLTQLHTQRTERNAPLNTRGSSRNSVGRIRLGSMGPICGSISGGAVWPDAWTFHARPLASDFGTRLSARSWGGAGDATNATDATGTQRLPRPMGGTGPRAARPVRLGSNTPAGQRQRDTTCLGDEGKDATEFPIRNHSFTPPRTFGTSHQTRRRSVCVPRLV